MGRDSPLEDFCTPILWDLSLWYSNRLNLGGGVSSTRIGLLLGGGSNAILTELHNTWDWL